MSTVVAPSRLRLSDAFRVSIASVRTRRLRAALTAGGVAIGIAAMVAVLGVSTSSRADLLARLDALGTNLLRISPGQSFLGDDTVLPDSSPAAARRVGPVQGAAAVGSLDATVRRSNFIPEAQTGGLGVVTAEAGLLETLHGSLRAGAFLDRRSGEHPVVVLGATATRRLGIEDLDGSPMVFIDGHWFTVVGILQPLELAPELDAVVMMGWMTAQALLDQDPSPSSIYVRATPDDLEAVRDVLPRTANPSAPEAVEVTRPSDALEARAAADDAFTALLLGLGGVALVVGGVGIANVMVVAVLERRGEIGVRRALGATRRHIVAQFLLEAVVLSGAGGILGVLVGAGITMAYASQRGWPFALPVAGLVGAATLALIVGAVAGLYPAARAALLEPAEAVRPA